MKVSTKKKEAGSKTGASKAKATRATGQQTREKPPGEETGRGRSKRSGRKSSQTSAAAETVTPISQETPLSDKRRKVPERSAPPKSRSTPASRKSNGAATVCAKADIGFGNTMFIRGEGGGLSWIQGTPLQNTGFDEWRWEAPARKRVEFKLLINDQIWSQGENFSVNPGQEERCHPAF